MLYKKDKGIIHVNRGRGKVSFGPLRGVIENIIIIPKDKDGVPEYVVYDLKILDGENDNVFFRRNIVGSWCYNSCVPIGKSYDENATFIIENSSYNIDFDVTILTKER